MRTATVQRSFETQVGPIFHPFLCSNPAKLWRLDRMRFAFVITGQRRSDGDFEVSFLDYNPSHGIGSNLRLSAREKFTF